ncbi:MAG: trypsin-like serine peptidase [Symbiobacteriia bacterium]
MDVDSLAEKLLFTTVRIETEAGDGTYGLGTGFIFGVPREDDRVTLMLVTNKHVVENANVGVLTFTQQGENGRPILGEHQAVRVNALSGLFIGHPNPDVDIAAMFLVPLLNQVGDQGFKVFYRWITSELIPSEAELADIDALEEVVFIGYPDGLWDSRNNLPIMRRGTTATPVTVDFMGQRQFLVDASVFPGSSGSPVFLYNPGTYLKKSTGTLVVGGRAHFLGILASAYYRQSPGEIVMRDIPARAPSTLSEEMLDLGLVFKASLVAETVQHALSLGQSRGANT